jgi:hypothetical protein
LKSPSREIPESQPRVTAPAAVSGSRNRPPVPEVEGLTTASFIERVNARMAAYPKDPQARVKATRDVHEGRA